MGCSMCGVSCDSPCAIICYSDCSVCWVDAPAMGLANFNFPTLHCESKSNEQRLCFSKRSATPLYSALRCQVSIGEPDQLPRVLSQELRKSRRINYLQ
jgi:hypothetical protein